MKRVTVVGFVVLGLVVLPGSSCSSPNLPAQTSAVGNPSTTTAVPGSGVTVNDPDDFAISQEANCLLQNFNHERLEANVVTVNWDQTAAGAATVHTDDMVARDYMALVSPEGIDLFTRLISSNPPSTATAAQYFIIQGSQSAGEVWNFIHDNSSTRAIVEDPRWRSVGIGYNPADGGYWTFLFTN